MNSSVRARSTSVKPARRRRLASESLYEHAVTICDPCAISRPRQWKSRAKRLLRECTASSPKHPKAYALLAYIHYLDSDYAAAEVLIRSALRFDADNKAYLRLLLIILLAQEKDALALRWLRKLANLEGIDISKLRKELYQSKLPADASTLVLNAFPNALGWFESYLSDEVEAIQLRERGKSSIDSEGEHDIEKYRQKKIDARKVPRGLRSLIPVALEWGIGDDVIRYSRIDQASTNQKRQLRKALPVEVRRSINNWLDRFNDGSAMTDEAACFMYLLLACEELEN